MVITNEEEYWKEHKKFKKEIGKLTRNMKLFFNNPSEYVDKFNELMDEGVKRQVITKEYAEEKKQKLLYEMTQPTKFKMFAREKIDKLKRKLKLKKKEEDE